ncbi:MAG: non-homologous end-joining DNA ligase [Ilumatobacteraceae bacterium]
MAGRSSATVVRVGERELSLSNLDKVLYPVTGTTKGEVIQYYAGVAAVMLPHLAGRCITLKRFPNGVDSSGFFEKRCPKHRPAWVGTFLGPGDREGEIGYCAFAEPADLVWAANMAAIELHVPMALAEDLDAPQILVFDLDPGPQTDIRTCCEVALWVREVLGAVGLDGWPKTSGSKGLQLYVPLNTPCTHEQAGDFALAVGQVLEKQHRDRVTTTMAKAVRPGKIFVDWSQNARHKTTIGVYSMRAREHPTVSTPVTWDEVDACAAGDLELRFTWDAVLARLDDVGDLFAPVLTTRQHLPSPA